MKYLNKISMVLIVFLVASSMISCEPDEENNTTDPVETTTKPIVEGTSNNDPITAASSGLEYISNPDGTCTLTGIGICTDTCLIIPDKHNGERVSAIAEGAFSANATITAVQIPANVVDIGNGAFSGCLRLAYISVADGNPAYTAMGGALYSRDETTLICVPAGSAMISLTLPKKVNTISNNAFADCINLTKVFYEGSEEDWTKVNIGNGNNILSSVELTCMTNVGK